MYLNSNTTQFFSQPVPDYQARGDVKNRSFFIYRGTMPVAEVTITAATACDLNGTFACYMRPTNKEYMCNLLELCEQCVTKHLLLI